MGLEEEVAMIKARERREREKQAAARAAVVQRIEMVRFVQPSEEPAPSCVMASGDVIETFAGVRSAQARLAADACEEYCGLCMNERHVVVQWHADEAADRAVLLNVDTAHVLDERPLRPGEYLDPYRFTVPCSGARAAQIAIKRYNAIGLPPKYASARIDCWDPRGGLLDLRAKQARTLAQSWEPRAHGAWFYGDRGTGKTHLMAAICTHLALTKHARVRWVSFRTLIDLLTSRRKESEQMADSFCQAEVLALDEVRAGGLDERAYDAFDSFIDSRNGNKQTTFITSNYSPSQLVELSAKSTSLQSFELAPLARAEDRLREMVVPLSMLGASYRGTTRSKTKEEKTERTNG